MREVCGNAKSDRRDRGMCGNDEKRKLTTMEKLTIKRKDWEGSPGYSEDSTSRVRHYGH